MARASTSVSVLELDLTGSLNRVRGERGLQGESPKANAGGKERWRDVVVAGWDEGPGNGTFLDLRHPGRNA